ncbi:MAG: peptidylprolyl isomerase [Azospirillum sp.]|nr:peptidylprolyl isomerase [Azospirillum sp.]
MISAVYRAALVAAALGFSLAPAAWAAEPAPAAVKSEEDPVVARVDGGEIRRSEVMQTVANLPAQVRDMPVQMLFGAVVDQLINAKLIAAAGYKENLAETPEVKERMKRAEQRAVQEVYLTRAMAGKITPEALEQRYQHWLTENPPQDEVHAAHILVASEAEAKALIKEIKAGGDFAKLAKEKSTDTAAAAQGGDLGFFTRDAMVPAFADAAFAMKPGQISESPVKTQFGWHVIKVVDRHQGTAQAFDAVKGELENDLSQEIVSGVIEELRAAAKIERFEADGSPQKPAAPAPLAPAQ